MNQAPIDFSKFHSVLSITSYFTTDAICRQAITESRWADGDVVCPYCGEHHCASRKDGKFRCHHCGKNFSCTVGTIFQNTKVSLIKWFIAMFLISSHKKGISSYQLARDVEVTQATAWYMLQKIRQLFAQNDTESFCGTVECDEVYIGGKEKWKHQSMRTPKTQGRSTATKTPVFGMMMRTRIDDEPMSYVHAFVVEKADKSTLQTIIGQFVEEGSAVVTDELSAYNGLESLGYAHSVVNHGAMQFANGSIFTNSIEGFWSHFRRMISGCYHNISDEHLQQYVDEACYRWNTRKASQTERFSDMFGKSVGLIRTWSELRLCA